MFVDRRDEMRHLVGALACVQDGGQGQVLCIVGPAGYGKSRIKHEFMGSDLVQSCRCLELETSYNDLHVPYASIARMLGALLDAPASVDKSRVVKVLRDFLDTIGIESPMSYAALATVLDLPIEDDAWERIEPAMRRREIQIAVRDVLILLSQQQPVVLVVEDLHWVDQQTKKVLDQVVKVINSAQILMLVTCRPDGHFHDWDGMSFFSSCNMNSLPTPYAHDLLDCMLGTDPGLIEHKRVIIQRTGGNPLFLEEFARSILEESAGSSDNGPVWPSDPSTSEVVPVTIRSCLESRIDRLDVHQKGLLKALSVIGVEAPTRMLAHVMECTEQFLDTVVDQLVDTELAIARIQGERDRWLKFGHSVLQDILYDSIIRNEQRLLHGRVFDSIKVVYADRLEDQHERLALHAWLAGRWQDAFEYNRLAGDKATEQHAYEQAIHYFERALGTTEHIEDDHERARAQLYLKRQLSTAYVPMGDLSRGHEYLVQARELACSLKDSGSIVEIGVYETAYLTGQGAIRAAVAIGEETLVEAQGLGKSAVSVASATYLAQAHFFAGDINRVVQLLEPHAPDAQGIYRHCRVATTATMSVDFFGLLGMAHALLGTFVRADQCIEKMGDISAETGRPFDAGLADFYRAYVSIHRGLIEESVEPLVRVLRTVEAGGMRFLAPWLAGILAFAYARTGRAELAPGLIKQAIDESRSMGQRVFEAYAHASASLLYLLEDDLEHASSEVEAGLTLTREHGYRSVEMWLLRVRGRISAKQGNNRGAIVELEAARQIGLELGMRPDVAHCHLFLGVNLGIIGMQEEAIGHIELANELYHELNMQLWYTEVEQVREQLRSTINA